ncbi:MAG: hypothetical protein ACTSR3_16620 [Candidatus Helarchaeota archaeon]
MEAQNIFEYTTDWVEYFDSVLKNEIRQEIDNPNKIKGSIVESNQKLDDFLKQHPEIKRVPSKEKFFHNLIIIHNSKPYYFYLNNQNERFWTIHNIEKQREVQSIIENLTANSYLQDKIYLSHHTLEKYQDKFNAKSQGFTINFEQLFTSSDSETIFKHNISDFENIGYSLQLWPKRIQSIDLFIKKLQKIDYPINFKSLNFVFEDESHDVLVKEDLTYDGATTIHRGKDFRQHLKFLKGIREDYSKTIASIEDYRVNWNTGKGGFFTIELYKEISPKNFINLINRATINMQYKSKSNPFKINAFYMYKEKDFVMYNGIDLHTGDQFYLQVFPSKLTITLDKNSCGNIILRLFTNLQRYFSISVKLLIDGIESGL